MTDRPIHLIMLRDTQAEEVRKGIKHPVYGYLDVEDQRLIFIHANPSLRNLKYKPGNSIPLYPDEAESAQLIDDPDALPKRVKKAIVSFLISQHQKGE